MDDDFEFYRDLEPSKLKEPKMEDFRYINLKNDDPFGLKKSGVTTESKDVLEFVPKKIEMVKKTKVKRKRRRTTIQIKSRRLKAFIIAVTMLAGYGVHSLVDFVTPYVRSYHEYESDRIMIAQLSEDYRVTQYGHLKSLDIKVKQTGFLDDGPSEFDFDNSDNIYINESGEKTGPLVDYYDGLDKYVAKHNGGKGYYETVYEMNENLEKLGIKPIDAGVYSAEELEAMFDENVEQLTQKEVSAPVKKDFIDEDIPTPPSAIEYHDNDDLSANMTGGAIDLSMNIVSESSPSFGGK